MKFFQKKITLNSFSRGKHLITKEIELNFPKINQIKSGLIHIFLQHTSASLTINENTDPSVRNDLENYFNKLIADLFH